MNDFVFQSPTKFVFGAGMVDQVGRQLALAGYRKALLVYGGGSALRNGTVDRVKTALAVQGIEAVVYGGVRPNPEVNQVRDGIDIARSEQVDVILPVGGGSVIDCAKAIAFGTLYDGDVWDFFCKKAKVTEALPIAVVLTLPAAGSEASASCVISNDELDAKLGISGQVFRPFLAVMDPELTLTLPAYQTAAGATDMIAHICERYFSGVGAVPVTDNVATGLIRSIISAARTLKNDPQNYDARANIMWAGMLAHNDLAGCGRSFAPEVRAGGWESHGMEHELSAVDPQVTHGAGLAVVLPAWMRYVWTADPDRFLAFGRDVFGLVPSGSDELTRDVLDPTQPAPRADELPAPAVEQAVLRTIDLLQAFFVSIGMPQTLREFGFEEADVERFVAGLEKSKGAEFGAFKRLNMDDARAIYRSAFSVPAGLAGDLL